jgi:hypothetical protein
MPFGLFGFCWVSYLYYTNLLGTKVVGGGVVAAVVYFYLFMSFGCCCKCQGIM